jgi:hypothetical protein
MFPLPWTGMKDLWQRMVPLEGADPFEDGGRKCLFSAGENCMVTGDD